MPTAVLDGIETRYEVGGSGPNLLMFSPGGFNAALENWSTHGLYRRMRILDQLRERFTCITYDKRESGQAGGRLERVTWTDYVNQGVALLDHLGVDRAHLMGGCVGCSIAVGLAVAHPDRVDAMVLYSPAGGVRYRRKQLARFSAHLAYVAEHGLAGVVTLAADIDADFSADGRVGPWVSVLRNDSDFAAQYADFDVDRYQTMVAGMSGLLFDRDTVPGAEPEDLMVSDIPALIVPGEDTSHAPSAARYLQECLPRTQYWDMPVAQQTDLTAGPRVIEFLTSV